MTSKDEHLVIAQLGGTLLVTDMVMLCLESDVKHCRTAAWFLHFALPGIQCQDKGELLIIVEGNRPVYYDQSAF